jgi:hypothetical protein
MFCHAREQVVPLVLELVTVNVNWVVVTDVIGKAVPLPTPLMLFPTPPAIRVTTTVGATPLVSKTNPAGRLMIMVPAPTAPLAGSE